MTADRIKMIVPLLVFAAVFPAMIAVFPPPSTVRDAYSYTMTAERLAEDGVYAFGEAPPGADVQPNAVVTPGWPLALAAIYEIGGWDGDSVTIARSAYPWLLLMMFIFSASTVLAIVLSARTLAGPNVGLAAGLVAALYAPLSWAGTVALAENLGASLFAWQIYVALRLGAVDSPRRLRHVAGFGALSAATILVRPNLALWVLIPLAYLALRRLESPRRVVQLTVAAALGFCLVMAPWWIRNEVVLGRFIPVKSAYTPVAESPATAPASETGLSAVEDGEYWEQTSVGVDLVRMAQPWVPVFETLYEEASNPGLPRIAYPDRHPASVAIGNFFALEALWYHRLLIALAAVSLLFAKRAPRLLLLAAAPLAVLAVHWQHLTTRYLYPTTPALIIMATLGAYGLVAQGRRVLQLRRAGGQRS